MTNKIYITAGLPVVKDAGQSPTVNTAYTTAGLSPNQYTPPPPKIYCKIGKHIFGGKE